MPWALLKQDSWKRVPQDEPNRGTLQDRTELGRSGRLDPQHPKRHHADKPVRDKAGVVLAAKNGLRTERWGEWPAHLATQLGEDAWRSKPLWLMGLFPEAMEICTFSISSNQWSRHSCQGLCQGEGAGGMRATRAQVRGPSQSLLPIFLGAPGEEGWCSLPDAESPQL